MRIGKLPNDVLEKMILNKLKKLRSEVVMRPGVGEDCGAIDLEDELCVVSTDPITGTDSQIGKLAVHVSCNDLASCGAEPLGLMVTILAPPGTEKHMLKAVMEQLTAASYSLNAEIIGGHTEITDAVNRMVINCTSIGKVKKGNFVSSSGAYADDDIVLTKWAGLEGTSIIAHVKEQELEKKIGSKAVGEAKSLIDNISVVKEGLSCAEFGVNAMHDVTEGGVLGALWEICRASDKGALVFKDKIPIKKETIDICNYYKINPYRLISSGCMMVAVKNGEELVSHLKSQGICSFIIGKFTGEKELFFIENNEKQLIEPPQSDELYKVL